MKSRLVHTLIQQPARWDGAGGGKIDLYPTLYSCNNYSYRGWINFEYRSYKWAHPEKWCADNISCVSHYNAVWSGTNHYDFTKEVGFIDQDHVTSRSYPMLLSHETGHMVGFRDPSYSGHCGSAPSVMHIPYYGCPNPGPGPTGADLWTFANDIALSLTH